MHNRCTNDAHETGIIFDETPGSGGVGRNACCTTSCVVHEVHSWLTVCVMTFGLIGCDGQLREKVGQSDVDASLLTVIPPPTCDQPMTPADTGDCTGGGKPGDDCLMCHHQGGGATPFAFAGTLYDAAGTTPVGGATMYLQDAVGNVAKAVSHPTNGNFYVIDGFVMYPAKAFVSLCPDVKEMLAPVDSATGANCNTSGCHTSGFRVHVP